LPNPFDNIIQLLSKSNGFSHFEEGLSTIKY
jgi:hypothetical protein